MNNYELTYRIVVEAESEEEASDLGADYIYSVKSIDPVEIFKIEEWDV